MTGIIEGYKQRAIAERNIGFDDAMKLYATGRAGPFSLMAAASEIREHFKGKTVDSGRKIQGKPARTLLLQVTSL